MMSSLLAGWIDTPSLKFTDRMAYYNAFDDYHVKGNSTAMEKLFARYLGERLDQYLTMLQVNGGNRNGTV